MARSKSDKQHIDGDIIEYLMLEDKEQTARSIARAIGYSKAKDVTHRLNSLHNKNIIVKLKVGNQVYWSIEQSTGIDDTLHQIPTKEIEINAPAQIDRHVGSLTAQDAGGTNNDELVAVILQLKEELNNLHKQVQCLELRISLSDGNDSIQSEILSEMLVTSPGKTPSNSPISQRIDTARDTATLKSIQNSWDTTTPNKAYTVLPQNTERSSKSLDTGDIDTTKTRWSTANRFTLPHAKNRCYDDCQGECNLGSNVRIDTSPNTQDIPVDMNLSKCSPPKSYFTPKINIPVVPGPQLYSKVHQNTISVVTDSMTNRIRSRDFNEHLLSGRAIFKKFPGATAVEINDYAASTIKRDTPRGLIVVAGANDVSYRSRDTNHPDVHQIAQDIIDIGLDAKRKGVKNIFISSIITRRGLRVEFIRREVNKILYYKCIENNFYYINNDNIGVEHLWQDGLHLNDLGASIFQNNLLRCFNEKLYIY